MATTSKTDKIEKIISRLQERIAEGQFYEAQQQTRVVAARYTKARNWSAAIDILSSVSQSLLKAGQGGSGGDLATLLVDVYKQAELKPDAESKGRLLACLRLFPPAEPTRKKFVAEMMSWSAKFGDYPAGDPELHHIIGSLYADEHEAADAERHLLLGTKDSPEALARMEYAWYKQDDSHTAAAYAARAVLPYLLLVNVRAANTAYRVFTAALVADNASLGVQDVSGQTGDLRVFPSLPLLNFLGLLLLAVQKGSPDLFRQLKAKYMAHIAELEGTWDEALDMVAEMYFGIQRPRQSNPLLDMMGSLLGGGGGGGASRRQESGPFDLSMAPGLD